MGEYLMHAWLDFATKPQKYTSFTYSWSASKEWKILDAVASHQLFPANADAVAYKIEVYKNSGLVVILQFSTQQLRGIFTIICAAKENRKINAVWFSLIS